MNHTISFRTCFGFLDTWILLWIDWLYLHGWFLFFSDWISIFIVVLWYKDAIVSKPFLFFSIERCFLSMNDLNYPTEPLNVICKPRYASLSDQQLKGNLSIQKKPRNNRDFYLTGELTFNIFCADPIESTHFYLGFCFWIIVFLIF